jgi:hypothetical protein
MSRPRKSPPPFPHGVPSQVQWARLAGFFSGEGSIGTRIHRKHGSVQVTLTIRQRWRPPLDEISSIFGGRVRTTIQGRGSFSAGTPVHVWYLSSYGETERILRGIYPYLFCKKRQAALAINLPYQQVGVQHKIHNKIQQLKRMEA